MGYRYNTTKHRWLATLLLITVTNSIGPVYVLAAEESADAPLVSGAAQSTEAAADDGGTTVDSETDEDDTGSENENEAEETEAAEPTVSEPDEIPADEVVATDEDVASTEVVSEAEVEEVTPEATLDPDEAHNPNTAVSEAEESDNVPALTSVDDSVGGGESAAVNDATSTAAAEDAGDREDSDSNTNDGTTHNLSGGDSEAVQKTETEAVTASSSASGARSSSESDSSAPTASIAATSSPATSSPATEIISSSTSTEAVAGESSDADDAIATTTATVTIESGKAVALANVINIVNTNFVNSDGVVFFSNFLETVNESIDFRWLYDALAAFGCSLRNCSNGDATINSSDTANIDNLMYLEAISGGNTISDTDAGVITTGDAYAGLNLINVANMNFIDSNYLLVTLNAFNDVNGDLVFPSADAFLSSLGSGPSSASLSTANEANIQNNLTLDANSGDNTLETSEGGSISAGASGATSNVFNQINSSFIGGQNITILFRIHGDWVGEVFGAPSDLVWQEGSDGSVFVFDTDKSTGTTGGAHSVLTRNTANITNDVQVVALTGENKITGTETGIISAGNAYAGANIVNLANGTVVGRNWILAIVNIFGDFKGNIAFGRPDLWVGEMIDVPKKVRDGSRLNYKFSVINNGDSVASNVILTDNYDSSYLKIVESSVPYTVSNSGALQFDVGTLASGKAAEISYTAEVIGVGNKSRKITNTVTVRSKETDDNMSDNTDTATIVTSAKESTSGATRVGVRKSQTSLKTGDTLATEMATDASALQVRRATSVANVSSDAPVIQQFVTLINRGDSIIPAVHYVDLLRDPFGTLIEEQVWELGNVLPGEEIELGYLITFKHDAPGGEYNFSSRIKSGTYEQEYGNGKLIYRGSVVPLLSTSSGGEQLVLGASDMVQQFDALTDAEQGVVTRIVDRLWNAEVPFPDNDVYVPAGLIAHSVSTPTQQHHLPVVNSLSQWFSQLYGYISTFISRLALAMNT